MVERASNVATGVPSGEGMSWWWNQAAPGASHTMRAGTIVETATVNESEVL